jgi:hypothetical protein
MDLRWLTGGRDHGNHGLYTRNHLGKGENGGSSAYLWKIVRTKTVGDPSCLSYGDDFNLYVQNTPRALAGAWGGGTHEGAGSADLDTPWWRNLIWNARSNVGNGRVPADVTHNIDNDKNPDPAFGECIEDLSAVFLQNKHHQNRWLTGSRDHGHETVYTKNMYDNDLDAWTMNSFTWILRKDVGNGKRNDALQCGARSTSFGAWHALQSSNADKQTITYTTGVERSSETSSEINKSWESSVTRSVTAGYTFGPDWFQASGEVTVEVGNTWSESMTTGKCFQFYCTRQVIYCLILTLCLYSLYNKKPCQVQSPILASNQLPQNLAQGRFGSSSTLFLIFVWRSGRWEPGTWFVPMAGINPLVAFLVLLWTWKITTASALLEVPVCLFLNAVNSAMLQTVNSVVESEDKRKD